MDSFIKTLKIERKCVALNTIFQLIKLVFPLNKVLDTVSKDEFNESSKALFYLNGRRNYL